MRWIAVLISMASPAFAQAVDVPSGQNVSFVELIRDDAGTTGETWRFRFLAPGIARAGGTVSLDAALEDMQAVCDAHVAPALVDRGVSTAQIIISLSDRDVPFGQADPAATQYFEAYMLEGGTCIWDQF